MFVTGCPFQRRAETARVGGCPVGVPCRDAAGYEGLWLTRRPERTVSGDTLVLDPARVPVNRRAKRRRRDRTDAAKMARVAGP